MNPENINKHQAESLRNSTGIKCSCENLEESNNNGQVEYGACIEQNSYPLHCNMQPETVDKTGFRHSNLSPEKTEMNEINQKIEPEQKFEKSTSIYSGNSPITLIQQYYPKRKEGYIFDVLPLPFIQNLEYQETRALSLKNEENYKLWKEFMQKLPDSLNETSKIDERFWRWKMYKRYMPEEIQTDFHKTMTSGPKLDKRGRLPITGEELITFRDIRENTNRLDRTKKILRKGEGTERLKQKQKAQASAFAYKK